MATKVARPTDEPTKAGDIGELSYELKDKAHLALAAFERLRKAHGEHLRHDNTASALGHLLVGICEHAVRFTEQADFVHNGSGTALLSTMSEALRLTTAETVDNEWARSAQNTLAILNYGASVEAEHIAVIAGVVADRLKAHVEGRGVPLAPAALKVYAEMRASAAKK